MFDPMISPKKDPAKHSSDLIVSVTTSWFATHGDSCIIQFPISNFKLMHNICLKIYLHDDLNLIRTGAIEKGTDMMQTLFNHITDVYHSLCYQYFVDRNSQLYRWISPDLPLVRSKVFSTMLSFYFFSFRIFKSFRHFC